MSVMAQKVWIRGEEFGEERRRMLLAGKTDDSPDIQALWTRLQDRDEFLWERFAKPLMERHKDQWAAVSLAGEVIVFPTASEALAEATKAFGPSNFAFGRLSDFPGHDTSRC